MSIYSNIGETLLNTLSFKIFFLVAQEENHYYGNLLHRLSSKMGF